MAEVVLVSSRASLACANCLTTQSQLLELVYDTTSLELSVRKTCVCNLVDDLETRYAEQAGITVEAM